MAEPWRVGGLQPVGEPVVGNVQGHIAVLFDGSKDAYVGPPSVAEIEGDHERSIEVWALDPRLELAYTTLVAWGRRAKLQNMAFRLGGDAQKGAAGDGEFPLGWGSPPSSNLWRHLAYTYDGDVICLYIDGVLRVAKSADLATASGRSIVIGAENAYHGGLFFKHAGPIAIARVRVHGRALSSREVQEQYSREAMEFGRPEEVERGYPRHRVSDDWLDVLALLDPAKHTHGDSWVSADEGLANDGQRPTCVTPPVAIDGDYELRLTCSLDEGLESLHLILPVGEFRQVDVPLTEGVKLLSRDSPLSGELDDTLAIDALVQTVGGVTKVQVDLNGSEFVSHAGASAALASNSGFHTTD